MPGVKSDYGTKLAKEWKVNAAHSLYDKNGKFYMPLDRFPGALFDPNGYVLFNSEDEYKNCPDVKIGAGKNTRVHVRRSISNLSGYKNVR